MPLLILQALLPGSAKRITDRGGVGVLMVHHGYPHALGAHEGNKPGAVVLAELIPHLAGRYPRRRSGYQNPPFPEHLM